MKYRVICSVILGFLVYLLVFITCQFIGSPVAVLDSSGKWSVTDANSCGSFTNILIKLNETPYVGYIEFFACVAFVYFCLYLLSLYKVKKPI